MSSIPLNSKGCIYAMSCGAIPDLIKLGCSTCVPVERAKQLTAATASPAPFIVLYSRRVSDCNLAEALLHERFDEFRVNEKREFFRISLEDAARAMDEISRRFDEIPEDSPAKMPLPWSTLFATFPDNSDNRELTAEEQNACRRLEKQLA